MTRTPRRKSRRPCARPAFRHKLLSDSTALALRTFTDLIVRLSEKMENLYFIGQRTHTGVLNLQALGYAAKQSGSSVEELQGTLEKFGYNLRSMPGFRVALKSIGVDASEARDWGDVLFDFVAKLKTYPEQQKLYMAQRFQIPVHLLDAFTTYLETAKKMRAEADTLNITMGIPNDIGKRMLHLAEGLSRLDMILEKIRQRFVIAFVDKFGDALDEFGNYLINHGAHIASVLVAIVEGLGKFLHGVYEFLKFFGLDLAQAETWRRIFIALGVVLALKVLPVVLGILYTLKDIVAFMLANPAMWPIIGIGAATYAIASHGGVKSWAKHVKDRWLGNGGAVDKLIAGGEQVIYPRGGAGVGKEAGAAVGARIPRGTKSENFKAMVPRIKARLKQDFPEMTDDDMNAVLGNLGEESVGFRQMKEVGGGGRGWAQWTSADRREKFLANVRRHGGDMANFDANYETLRDELKGPYAPALRATHAQRTLAEKTHVFMNKFENPGVPHEDVRQGFARVAQGVRELAVSKAVAAEASHPTVTASKPLGAERNRLLKSTDKTNIENHLTVETTGAEHSEETARNIGNVTEAATRKALDDKIVKQKKGPSMILVGDTP